MDWFTSCFCAGCLFIYSIIFFPWVSACIYIFCLCITASLTHSLLASIVFTGRWFNCLPLAKSMSGCRYFFLFLKHCSTYWAMASCRFSCFCAGCWYLRIFHYCMSDCIRCFYVLFYLFLKILIKCILKYCNIFWNFW